MGRPGGSPFGEFGSIGGQAVVLDACDTASDRWLYTGALLRAECQALKDKALLGGSGKASPNEVHGKKILTALLDVLAEVEDAALCDQKLLALLHEVRDRAAWSAAHNSKFGAAYAARIVHPTLGTAR